MQEHVETFFAQVEAKAGSGLPDFVKDEFDVALVPRPRLNLIRFHGVLAPNAKLRSEIIPGGKKNKPILSDTDDDKVVPAKLDRLLISVMDNTEDHSHEQETHTIFQ